MRTRPKVLSAKALKRHGGGGFSMKHPIPLVLLGTLFTVAAPAADLNVTTTTIAQQWKQDTPGFDKANFLPATEFLGVDATGLGSQNLSLHLFGWGTRDLQDPSSVEGKGTGNLTYGYLQYNFDQANAAIRAGRFIITQGAGNEQLDGISARTDLRGGFNISAFTGAPVAYKNLSANPQAEIGNQQNMMFGTRLGLRLPRTVEIGVSYLQDGSNTSIEASATTPNYTRKQMGADLHLAPCTWFDVTGRTLWNLAQYVNLGVPSRVAEDDYSLNLKLSETVKVSGQFVERNLASYFAGSTLPNLFNASAAGVFKATGGSLTWTPGGPVQLVVDARRTARENYGDSTRCGADLRFTFSGGLLAGGGFHRVNAFRVVQVDPANQSYSLSHDEARVWAMWTKGAWVASLDAIRFMYADAAVNPDLNFKSSETEVVGGLGCQLSAGLKVSGDLTYETTPIYTKQVMGLLRVEYRFGLTGLGGK